MPCPCSMTGVRSLVSAKLGACPRCVAMAAGGSVAGWTLTRALRRGGAPRLVYGPVRLAAITCSLLLAAHVVAYRVRRRPPAFGAPL